MTNEADFDALAKTATESRGEETFCNLFGAVFALSNWHFIAVGELPDLLPYCAAFPDHFDGQPMVVAFTDTERLNKYIAEKNLHVGSADKPVVLSSPEATVKFSSENLVLSVPTTSVIKYLERLVQKGVKGIFFNPNIDSHGFNIGLAQLPAIKALVESKKIKAETEETAAKYDFDALSRKVNESVGAMEDLNRLFGAAFALGEWLFVARGELPNINPYVASKADYENGQQMIRAFTDSKRLVRFAKENNLANADGGAEMLAVPTGGIVEYLEGFIKHDVYGVWFNSDTESDGFSIPLKQLRSIKIHLEKLNAEKSPAAKQPTETAVVVIKDGLMLPSGFVKEADYFSDCFCRIPKDWTDGADVTEAARQKIFEMFYGKNWQAGNSDGSRYVVRRINWKVFTPAEAQAVNWSGTTDTAESHYFFFIADEFGELKRVSNIEFETDIRSAYKTNIAVPPKNDSSPFAVRAQHYDGYLNWFRRGKIKPDTTFKPFFQALAPILNDYAGLGEFTFSFATGSDEPNMKDLFEDVTSNSHGAFLKYRSYVFQRTPNDPTYEIQVIGSNCLTNTQTGEKLIVHFTMHKTLENQETTLIVQFRGLEAEIEKLGNAVKSALDACEFKVQLESKKPPSDEALKAFGG